MLTQYSDVIDAFESVTFENYTDFFMIVKEASSIEKMMVQRLKRVVNNVETSFLSIRDIRIEESSQQKGIFSNFLSILEQKGIPVMIDDIVNNKLDDFLMRRGYHAFTYEKYGEKVRARYLMK
jgi:hypothetical protein